MAHFVQMNDNTCGTVIVVRDEDILDTNGDVSETLGQEYIKRIGLEGTWLLTSLNGSFRGKYPLTGDKYDPELDEFVTPTIEE